MRLAKELDAPTDLIVELVSRYDPTNPYVMFVGGGWEKQTDSSYKAWIDVEQGVVRRDCLTYYVDGETRKVAGLHQPAKTTVRSLMRSGWRMQLPIIESSTPSPPARES
jgi:hypothetical protein